MCEGETSSEMDRARVNDSYFYTWKIQDFLTFCMPGQPSKGYLKPPWHDVGWPVVGYCHPFYLKRCSSR